MARALSNANFKDDEQRGIAVTLYASILELTHDALWLIKGDRFSGVPILLRTMVEACVDLKAVVNVPRYAKFMESTWVFEEQRKLKHVLNLESLEFLVPPERISQLKNDKDAAAKELEDLKSKGFNGLNKKDMFEKAELGDWYSPMYATLCAHSHNGPDALLQRHFKENSDGEYVHGTDWDPKHIDLFIKNIGLVLATACSEICVTDHEVGVDADVELFQQGCGVSKSVFIRLR
jgi:hypothetical protein